MFKFFIDEAAMRRIGRFQHSFCATNAMLHDNNHHQWKTDFIKSFR